MKYLITGLGNIGSEYLGTRHNIGFMAVDALAKAAGATFTDGRYGFTTTLSVKGRQRQRRTLLDAKGKHSIGECVGSGR